MDHLNYHSPHWSSPENINFGGFVQNACNDLNKSQTKINFIVALVTGCLGKPVVRIIDILAHGILGTVKIATGVTIIPVVKVWNFCQGKKVHYNWTLSQGIDHYAMSLFYLLDIPLSFFLNFNPDLYLKVIRVNARLQEWINLINEEIKNDKIWINDLLKELNKFINITEKNLIESDGYKNEIEKDKTLIASLQNELKNINKKGIIVSDGYKKEIENLSNSIKELEATIELKETQIKRLQETKKKNNKIPLNSQNEPENIKNNIISEHINNITKERDELREKLTKAQDTSIHLTKLNFNFSTKNKELSKNLEELSKKLEVYESIKKSITDSINENKNTDKDENPNIVLDKNLLNELLSSSTEKDESVSENELSDIEDETELSDTEDNNKIKNLMNSSIYGKESYSKFVEIKRKEREIDKFENALKIAINKINLKKEQKINDTVNPASKILNNSQENYRNKQQNGENITYNNAEKNLVSLFVDAGLEEWIEDMKDEYIVKEPSSGNKININWWSLLTKTMISYNELSDYDKRTTNGIHREFFVLKIQAKEGLNNPFSNSNIIREFKMNAEECLDFNFKNSIFSSLCVRNQKAETQEDVKLNSAAKFLQILRTMKYVRSKTNKEKKFLKDAAKEILEKCESQAIIVDNNRKNIFAKYISDILEIIDFVKSPQIVLSKIEKEKPAFKTFKENLIEFKLLIVKELNKIESISNSNITIIQKSFTQSFEIEKHLNEIIDLLNILKGSYEKLEIHQRIKLENPENRILLNNLLDFAEGCFRALDNSLDNEQNKNYFDINGASIKDKIRQRNLNSIARELKQGSNNISVNIIDDDDDWSDSDNSDSVDITDARKKIMQMLS